MTGPAVGRSNATAEELTTCGILTGRGATLPGSKVPSLHIRLPGLKARQIP